MVVFFRLALWVVFIAFTAILAVLWAVNGVPSGTLSVVSCVAMHLMWFSMFGTLFSIKRI